MSTKHIEALKLALEGAANYIDALGGDSRKYRQALAEQPAQQEAVAIALNTGTKQGVKWLKNVEHGEHLYTSPPAQEFVCSTGLCHYRRPLTDEQIVANALHLSGLGTSPDVIQFARAIEAAHGIKEKNT